MEYKFQLYPQITMWLMRQSHNVTYYEPHRHQYRSKRGQLKPSKIAIASNQVNFPCKSKQLNLQKIIPLYWKHHVFSKARKFVDTYHVTRTFRGSENCPFPERLLQFRCQENCKLSPPWNRSQYPGHVRGGWPVFFFIKDQCQPEPGRVYHALIPCKTGSSGMTIRKLSSYPRVGRSYCITKGTQSWMLFLRRPRRTRRRITSSVSTRGLCNVL